MITYAVDLPRNPSMLALDFVTRSLPNCKFVQVIYLKIVKNIYKMPIYKERPSNFNYHDFVQKYKCLRLLALP